MASANHGVLITEERPHMAPRRTLIHHRCDLGHLKSNSTSEVHSGDIAPNCLKNSNYKGEAIDCITDSNGCYDCQAHEVKNDSTPGFMQSEF